MENKRDDEKMNTKARAINSQEEGFLFKKKVYGENKTNQVANEEIQADKSFIKDYYLLKSENEQLTRELARANEKIEVMKMVKKEKSFKEKFKELTHIGTKKEELEGNVANIHHLNRIMNSLKEKPKQMVKELSQNCCCSGDAIKSGLGWLIKDNKVIMQQGNKSVEYSLK